MKYRYKPLNQCRPLFNHYTLSRLSTNPRHACAVINFPCPPSECCLKTGLQTVPRRSDQCLLSCPPHTICTYVYAQKIVPALQKVVPDFNCNLVYIDGRSVELFLLADYWMQSLTDGTWIWMMFCSMIELLLGICDYDKKNVCLVFIIFVYTHYC